MRDELGEALEQISAQAPRAGEVIRRLRAMVTPRTSPRTTIDCNRIMSELITLAEPGMHVSTTSTCTFTLLPLRCR
jgi:hypothetical protein